MQKAFFYLLRYRDELLKMSSFPNWMKVNDTIFWELTDQKAIPKKL